MRETHTPGPWTVEHSPIRTLGAADRATIYPAGYSHISMRIANVKGEGNINLIAASPDMLAALEAIQTQARGIAEACNSITDNAKYWTPEYIANYAQELRLEVERLQDAARAAIAKAIGER